MNNQTLLKRLDALDNTEVLSSLREIKRGFEKECLRVDDRGMLAQTPHPVKLGSSLTNPLITTDYSEALLEFVTMPTNNIHTLFSDLTELHQYTESVLDNEYLWAGSMPCYLPTENEIPIAEYGHSNNGQLKHIYRKGLGYRYGRAMQTIAGIHYNFSFSENFWQLYQRQYQLKDSDDFISEHYLGMIRNTFRIGWILPFLFGATPAISHDFLNKPTPILENYENHTLYGPYATSLRLSDLGYNNKAQSLVRVSYNSFRDYINTMNEMVHTPYADYRKIGVRVDNEYRQLSDNILQIEDEHYAIIRPKRISGRDERMLPVMKEKGIEYLELRVLDLNPFVNVGVEKNVAFFLDAFLLYCLLMESPFLDDAELSRIKFNHQEVVMRGRKPNLILLKSHGKPTSLSEWAHEILEGIKETATLLMKATGEEAYLRSWLIAKEGLEDTKKLPSARLLAELSQSQGSYFDFTKRWSLKHQDYFKHHPLEKEKQAFYAAMAEDSLSEQKTLALNDHIPFDAYLKQYLS